MMANWYATFEELRLAGIPLHAWLEFHRLRRASLTPEERADEDRGVRRVRLAA